MYLVFETLFDPDREGIKMIKKSIFYKKYLSQKNEGLFSLQNPVTLR